MALRRLRVVPTFSERNDSVVEHIRAHVRGTARGLQVSYLLVINLPAI